MCLGVNLPAAAMLYYDQSLQMVTFLTQKIQSPFTNSTLIPIFDDLGNPTIATVILLKLKVHAEDPTNKFDTRLVINDTVIDPDLVSAGDDTEIEYLLVGLELGLRMFQTITTFWKERFSSL